MRITAKVIRERLSTRVLVQACVFGKPNYVIHLCTKFRHLNVELRIKFVIIFIIFISKLLAQYLNFELDGFLKGKVISYFHGTLIIAHTVV